MGFQSPENLNKQLPSLSTPPPKLSLYSLPKPPDHGLTPPLNTLAMIPFLWEEAPGKPRPTFTHNNNNNNNPPKSNTVRSLDLPPRLTTTTTTTTTVIIPSPTTVLSGPYNEVGSKTVLGSSPEKISSKGKTRRTPLRMLMRKDRSSPVKFSSWRWDSGGDDRSVVMERSPSLKFCSWRWDSFRDMSGGGGGSSDGGGASSFDDRQNNKIGKAVTRKNSFTFAGADATNNTSGFLANMYGTFKKAMPWKSRRSQK
ncbi:hypothetical protein L6452_04469 [Arctium lappa]|uniref:Uncharacterized protein n=1 Tax=Arctium lappa TaxID=4217 RepID=A0ACB9EDQ3_ARCLA|nr:hypothetical protein L6452_04469 [Arctium lappa]